MSRSAIPKDQRGAHLLRELHINHGKEQPFPLVHADQKVRTYVLHIGRIEFRQKLFAQAATAASRSDGASGSPGGVFTHSLL